MKNYPLLWSGFELDEDVNFYYTNGRWYDRASGRYRNNSGGLNGYVSFGNNPIKNKPAEPSTSELVQRIQSQQVLSDFYDAGSIGETYRSILGDDYLAGASDSAVFWLAVGPAIAGGLSGGYAFAAAGAYGLGTIGAGAISGAVAGAAEYLATQGIARFDSFVNGGRRVNDPRFSDFATFTLAGAATGGLIPFAGPYVGAGLRNLGQRTLSTGARSKLASIGRSTSTFLQTDLRSLATGRLSKRGEYLRQKYGHLSPSQRSARIDELSRSNYLRRLDEELSGQQFVYRYLTEEGFQTSQKYNSVRGYATTHYADNSLEVVSKPTRLKLAPCWQLC